MNLSRFDRSSLHLQDVFRMRKFAIKKVENMKLKQQLLKQFIGTYVDPRDNKTKIFRCFFVSWRDLKSTASLGTEDLNLILKQFSDTHHFIFILDKISFQAVNILLVSGKIWETFSYDETQFNIMRSRWTAKYTLLDPKDVPFDPLTLPIMLTRVDRAGRIWGFREGDVVKVEMPNPLTGTHTSYRYVRSNFD